MRTAGFRRFFLFVLDVSKRAIDWFVRNAGEVDDERWCGRMISAPTGGLRGSSAKTSNPFLITWCQATRRTTRVL